MQPVHYSYRKSIKTTFSIGYC